MLENFSDKIARMKITLTKEQADKIIYFYQLLSEWNKKINLTRITDPNDFIEKHIMDSISIISEEIAVSGKVCDLGTGGGFPGIPIKILIPEIEMTFIDSILKKIKVVEDIGTKLLLKNCQYIHSNAKQLVKDKKWQERFDLILVRAVGEIKDILNIAMPLLKKGGKVVLYKSWNVENELDSAQRILEKNLGKIINIRKFLIPETAYKRCLIVVEKCGKS
jgi:16S rRNA (guanine527-N7)-methyltransferase